MECDCMLCVRAAAAVPGCGTMQALSGVRIIRTVDVLWRHGTYARSALPGTRIARRQSSQSHTTFSLLPNCLAARFPGTFDTLEVVVVHAEAPTQSAAANALRTGSVGLSGAMRWVRRRVRRVHHVLTIVIGLPASTSPGASPMSRP